MRHEDETVLINANWMPFKYFCSRFSYFYTQRIEVFYKIDLYDINSPVVKKASCYGLRKSLNSVSRPRTEQGCRSLKQKAAISWYSLSDTILTA